MGSQLTETEPYESVPQGGELQGDTAISVSGLVKRYGRKTAVDGLSFDVRRGEVFGLLGPNGAGKSTVIKTLCGLASPTSGVVSLNGFDCRTEAVQARRSLGYVPEVVDLYGEMTGSQLLRYASSFYDMPSEDRARRMDALLEQVGLAEAASGRVRTYSKGMRQRLALAAALVHSPDVLILDEPMSGLDPIGTRDVRGIIDSLRGRTTVLFSSHNLYEAEALCDRVAVMSEGRLVALDSLANLLRGQHLVVRMRLREVPEGLPRALEQDGLAEAVEVVRDGLSLRVRDESARPAILRRAVEQGAEVYEMATDEASLEEVFARLLRDGRHE